MSNTTPEGLGPKQNEYTVFAVYESNFQPYAATVLCENPEEACRLAQLQCVEDNGADAADYPNRDWGPLDTGAGYVQSLGDFGDYTLTAFQVVIGKVEVVL